MLENYVYLVSSVFGKLRISSYSEVIKFKKRKDCFIYQSDLI